MKLYSSPQGKTFSGVDRDLEFQQHIKSYPTKVLPIMSSVKHSLVKNLTDKEILRHFKEESVGADCQPICGNCECGKCPLGTKPLSIKKEEEYRKFLDNMYLDETGT